MGYYTKYDLNFFDKETGFICGSNYQKLEKDIIADLMTINSTYFDCGDVDSLEELFEEEMKWYDYEEDIKHLSADFPNLIFTLYGKGEDNGDNWVAYFNNGESEICYSRIVYDEPTSWFGKKVNID